MTHMFSRTGRSFVREHRLAMMFGEMMSSASEVASEAVPAATETAESFCKTPEMLNDYAVTGIAGRCTDMANTVSEGWNAGMQKARDVGTSAVQSAGDFAAKGVEWGANKLGSAAQGVGNAIGGPVGIAGGMLAKSTIESGGAFAAGGIRTAANSFGDTIGGTTGSGSHIPNIAIDESGAGKQVSLPNIFGGELPGGDELPRTPNGGPDFKSSRWPGTPPIVDPNAQPRGPEDSVPDTPTDTSTPPLPALDEPPAPKEVPATTPDAPVKSEAPTTKPAQTIGDAAKTAADPGKGVEPAAQAKNELTNGQKFVLEKHHDWVMDDKTKEQLDRAAQAEDALNGDDKALQKFIDEDAKQDPSIVKDVYQWANPQGYKAKALEKVRAKYEEGVAKAKADNKLSDEEFSHLMNHHRNSKKAA